MKRRPFKLVVFLLLGAIVNVAVAWGCTLIDYGDNFWHHSPTEDATRWWDAHAPGGFPVFPLGVGESLAFGVSATIMYEQLSSPPKPSIYMVIRRRAGLPVRALEGSRWIDFTEGGRRVIERHRMKVLNDRPHVPLWPLWPGFAINTVFYAALLWLLTLGPFTARRIIRRKRGHCIKCGYDLRDDLSSGCPECGWRREEAS